MDEAATMDSDDEHEVAMNDDGANDDDGTAVGGKRKDHRPHPSRSPFSSSNRETPAPTRAPKLELTLNIPDTDGKNVRITDPHQLGYGIAQGDMEVASHGGTTRLRREKRLFL